MVGGGLLGFVCGEAFWSRFLPPNKFPRPNPVHSQENDQACESTTNHERARHSTWVGEECTVGEHRVEEGVREEALYGTPGKQVHAASEGQHVAGRRRVVPSVKRSKAGGLVSGALDRLGTGISSAHAHYDVRLP